ncbi:hypothetical protein ACFY9A_24650 [Streptomyces rubradiris]|uniref:hypothetical protein n=1 Tax=Streptomyces rubradiris TaxID=285531 RepID=UPI0036F08302
MPAYITKLSGSDNLALAGGAVTLMLACSVLAQTAAAGRRAGTGLPRRHHFAAVMSALCLLDAAVLFRRHMTGRGADGLP